jgi:periplasmic divalent cation tolerance protein
MSEKYSLIYTVFPDAEQAKKVARVLVQKKLVACCNILPAHTAIYEWQGQMCEESEVIMLAKTISTNFGATQAQILELHSYETPCVLEIALANVAPEFAKWIENCLNSK